MEPRPDHRDAEVRPIFGQAVAGRIFSIGGFEVAGAGVYPGLPQIVFEVSCCRPEY